MSTRLSYKSYSSSRLPASKVFVGRDYLCVSLYPPLHFFLTMRTSPLIRSFSCITSFISAVRAFSVTVGSPTQCDDLTVSWTGGYIFNIFHIILLRFDLIVRWAGTIRDPSDSRSSSLSPQGHPLRTNIMPSRFLRSRGIYLYQHQPSAMAKAHIQ